MENPDKIKELLNKPEWSDEERSWLLDYLHTSNEQELRNLLQQQFEEDTISAEPLSGELSRTMLQNIHKQIGVTGPPKRSFVFSRRILTVAAACIIGILAFSAYLFLSTDPPKPPTRAVAHKAVEPEILAPKGNKATLTLADGSTIVLDDKQNGFLTDQGNTKVIKLNGKLVYDPSNANAAEVDYNTITTPAGGQYQIELPDGSLVWLNAGSSLRFPTAFVGAERRVEVKGEVYFEVRKNAAMPFKVKVNNAEVQVLGTRFNIMAYDDEATLKTTLLEGEVRFASGGSNKILKPGQQTQLAKNGNLRLLNHVDVDEVMAWKNGMFNFKGSDLVTIGRQLSRWYDVEMIFDKTTDELFYADIPRSTKLKDVLKVLELTGKVRFTVQARKILVKQIN